MECSWKKRAPGSEVERSKQGILETGLWPDPTIIDKVDEVVSLIYIKLFATLIVYVIFLKNLSGFPVLTIAFIPPWNDYKFSLPVFHQHISVWIMKIAEHGTGVWTPDVTAGSMEKSSIKKGKINLGKCHSWTLKVIKAKLSGLHNQFFNSYASLPLFNGV